VTRRVAFVLVLAATAVASAKPREGPPPRAPAPVPLAAFAGEPSKKPTLAEWKEAPEVAIARRSPAAHACRVQRVREWTKVHCDVLTSAVRQLAGNTDDVLPWVVPNHLDPTELRSGAEVIFPLRRGDRRIFQFYELSGGAYDGFGSEPGVVVEARWLSREAEPSVILR
jgi:hypothetical protein